MAAVVGNTDILLITETNIESTFSVNQFYLNDFNVPTAMTVILTAVTFWVMFALTLGHL